MSRRESRKDDRIEAGKLDRRITFQTEVELSPRQSEMGTPLKQWVDAFECWAAFEPVGTREFPSSVKLFAETTGRFRIYYREELDPTFHPHASSDYRVLFNDTIWDIQPATLIGRRVGLLIEAKSIQPPIEA